MKGDIYMSYYNDIQNKYRVEEHSLHPSLAGTTLRLELSNICNHKCIFCLNSEMPRERRQMPDELVYRIIEQAGEAGVKKAGFFMNGEPFISTKLADYLAFARKQGIEYLFITTNGALATPEKLDAVFGAGLDSIKFSINAGTRETYKKIHGSDDFDKVISHLKYANKYRKRTGKRFRILSTCVVTDDVIGELEELDEMVSPLVDELVFFHANNFAGQADANKAGLKTSFHSEKVKEFQFEKVVPCPYLWNTISITCEGYMTLCIEEVNNKMVFADLNEVSLIDAWNSEVMVDMRKRHIEKNLANTQCYNCVYHANEDVPPLSGKLFRKSQKSSV